MQIMAPHSFPLNKCFGFKRIATPVEQAPTPRREKLSIMLGIAKGIDFLHSLSPPVVHCDIKLRNICIRRDGSPCLVDFGLAKELRAAIVTRQGDAEELGAAIGAVTAQDFANGTLPYLAPEVRPGPHGLIP